MPKKMYKKADVREDGRLEVGGNWYNLEELNKAIFVDSTVQFSPEVADAITALATYGKGELADAEEKAKREQKLAELSAKMESVVNPILQLSREAIAAYIGEVGPKAFRFSLVTGNVSIDIPCLSKDSEDMETFRKELGENFKSLGFELDSETNEYSPSESAVTGTRAEPTPILSPGNWKFNANEEKGIKPLEFVVLESGRTEVNGERISHPKLLELAGVPPTSNADPERPYPWPGKVIADHATML